MYICIYWIIILIMKDIVYVKFVICIKFNNKNIVIVNIILIFKKFFNKKNKISKNMEFGYWSLKYIIMNGVGLLISLLMI